ncbi:hypothetical protein ACFQ1E_19075 [Sphingomonas canadensis]|uniref:Small CPxCG-related zinc finger protein n=1 Tax=Sphingomonas canadensis TaxID=1219257 RepID=A0ABW3HBI2_9SPHN|nr:hypothetical protein [Sphingomonas canadensis]MCW3838214.1 hypothetical protein [Sphingomonas canadensis]
METPVEYRCRTCTSSAVTRDAWASWDVVRQGWVLTEVFDFDFCHQCHRETELVAVPAWPPDGA